MTPARPKPIAVYLEVGTKKTFAAALDWPGWCRAGKDEDGALEALADYAARYAPVAADAGLRFPANAAAASAFDVVERLPGTGTTNFGAPGSVAAADAEPLTAPAARRLAALVEASWRTFDRIVASAPAELRKGPRGGGRDRDKIVEHVLGAEESYARTIGVRLKPPDPAALRVAIADALSKARSGAVAKGWPPRYAARRIAWHVLDHAWEIEDKSP